MSSGRRVVLFVVLAAALLVGAGLAGVSAIEDASKGPAFALSSRFLANDPTVRQELGAVTGFGFTVAGSVVESASEGRAHIDFDVIGSWRTGHAVVRATKRGGQWRIDSAVLDVDGSRFRLPVPSH